MVRTFKLKNEENQIVHFFCIKNENKNEVYCDVRGFSNNTYDFFETEIFEKDIILIYQKTDSKFTTGQYKIHTQIIEKTLDKPVVLVLDKIESYNRLRLIKQKINFIIILF